MFLVLVFTALIPATICWWLVRTVLGLGQINPLDEPNVTSPFRVLISVVLPIFIVANGYYKKKSLSLSGAAAALVVGFVLTISNYCFFGALLTFFLVASKATRLGAARKKKLESDYKEGGQRNWVQVICNGGVATEAALIYLMEVGSREALINFSDMYTRSWFCMSVLGALACSCGDTLASEIGSVYGWMQPRLATTLRHVPIGTNGGVTVIGLISSLVGGALVGVAYYTCILLANSETQLAINPAQWPVVVVGGAAGFVGSWVDSILGATLQYSGWDSKKSCVVETPGKNVESISGFPLLDNHTVNLLASLIMAFVTPRIAVRVWGLV